MAADFSFQKTTFISGPSLWYFWKTNC